MRLFGYRITSKDNSPGIGEKGIGLVKKGGNAFGGKDDDEPQDITLQQKYKNAYDNFPIVQSAVDIVVEQAVQDFHFEGPNKVKLEKIRQKIKLDKYVKRWAKEMRKHGNCWTEVVGDGKDIEQMKILNPLEMHTIRTATGDVKAQIQLPNGVNKAIMWGKVENKTFHTKKVEKSGKLKNCMHFRYNVQNCEKYGTPPVHSALTMLTIKDQIEGDLKVVVRRYIAPIIHAQIGDEMHPPSEDDVDAVEGDLEDIYSSTEYATSYLVKMNVLGFEGMKGGMNFEPILNHVDEQIMKAMGVFPVLSGGSGGTDRATAEVQLRAEGRHVKAFQKDIKNEIETKFIVGLGLGTKEDSIVFEYTDERERSEEIDYIIQLKNAHLITPQAANDLLPSKFHEDLPKELTDPNPMGMGGPEDDKISKLDNPNDPTKSTEIKPGKRVKKTDVENPLNAKPQGREEVNK